MSKVYIILSLYTILSLFTTAYDASQPAQPIQVIVFLSTECPISQQYIRRLNALHTDFRSRNVTFEAYYPLPTDTDSTIKAFHRLYNISFPGHPDPGHKMVKKLRAHITPEVVVQTEKGHIVYQGAIDDWYFTLGKHQPKPTRHYLQDALESVLSGRPIIVAKTQAVGCLIE